jgi:hypothetical protein
MASTSGTPAIRSAKIAGFFDEVMSQDAERAARCHEFLKELSGSKESPLCN